MLHKFGNFCELGDTKMQCVSLKIKVFFRLEGRPRVQTWGKCPCHRLHLNFLSFFFFFFLFSSVRWLSGTLREKEEKEGNLVKAPSSPVVAKIPREEEEGPLFSEEVSLWWCSHVGFGPLLKGEVKYGLWNGEIGPLRAYSEAIVPVVLGQNGFSDAYSDNID